MRRSFVGLCVLVGLGWGTDAFAAKKFQGMVEYKFTVTGENAAIAALIVPSSIRMHVRGNDTRIEMVGGMLAAMAPVVVRHAKTHKMYTISAADAKVTVADDPEDAAVAPPTAERLQDVTTIAGYPCEDYAVRQADGTVARMWTTDALALPPLAMAGGAGAMLGQAGVPGMVMRVMIEQQGMNVTLEAVDVDLTKPAKSLFVIPKDYAMVPAEAP